MSDSNQHTSNVATKSPLGGVVLSKVEIARATSRVRKALPVSHPPLLQASKEQQKNPVTESNLVEVKGEIVRILFSNAETGKSMFLIKEKSGSTFKLLGIPTMDPEIGREVIAWASIESHPKYGDQFTAEIIDEMIPLDRRGAIGYMSRNLDGIGEELGGKIFDAFGSDTFNVFSYEPHRLREIPGIVASNYEEIISSWNERSIVQSLWTILGKHEGLGNSVPAKIYAKFGDQSIDVVRHHPYEIAKIDGIGFKIADMIALDAGFPWNSAARISGAIGHILQQDYQQGHTSKPASAMVEDVSKITNFRQPNDIDKIKGVLSSLVKRGDLVMRLIESKPCVTPKSAAFEEISIAKRLKELTDACGINRNLAAEARRLSADLEDAEQEMAVVNVFLHPISVITGRPGCGKTTVTKIIAQVAAKAGLKIVMCAAWSNAAQRMAVATGFESGTVHSLIGLRPSDQGGVELKHTRANPLKGDLFVLDEASTMDTTLTCDFLNAIPNGARLVIVGDVDQISSVNPGNVLYDFIESGKVAVSRLITPHRTAADSDIILNAHRIINGDVSGLDLSGKKDFQFKSATEDWEIISCALSQFLELVVKHGVENVQMLTARRGTATGVYALNEALRKVINPPAPEKPFIEIRGQILRLGDRVIRTRKNKKLGVANGEVGIITHVDTQVKKVVVKFGIRNVIHERNELAALELANAITFHKSQGSEYAGVVLVTPRSHKSMLNRNLVYTGTTRGKKDVRWVGSRETVLYAVSRPSVKRCTGLAAEIKSVFEKSASNEQKQDSSLTSMPSSAVECARKTLFRRRPN